MEESPEPPEPFGKVIFDAEEVAVFVERSDYAMRYHPGMASLVLVSYPERYIYMKGIDLARSNAKIFPVGCNPRTDQDLKANVSVINRGLPLMDEIPTAAIKEHLSHQPRFLEIEFTLSEIRVRGVELGQQERQSQGMFL